MSDSIENQDISESFISVSTKMFMSYTSMVEIKSLTSIPIHVRNSIPHFSMWFGDSVQSFDRLVCQVIKGDLIFYFLFENLQVSSSPHSINRHDWTFKGVALHIEDKIFHRNDTTNSDLDSIKSYVYSLKDDDSLDSIVQKLGLKEFDLSSLVLK